MTKAKNYYELLGLHYEAEDIVVRAAYKALAQKYHPDKSPSNTEQATLVMTQFSEAFQVLNDPKLRKRYDEVLSRKAFSNVPSEQANSVKPKADSQASSSSAKSYQDKPDKNDSNSDEANERSKERPQDFETTSDDERSSQFALNLTQKLIEKIEANQIDEGHLVSLFEKLFQHSLTIHHGMLNSYSFEYAGKKYTHNFSTLKAAILRRLQEACV
jgi:DnaJ-class molecular chaperone